jgi:hypothetical protein
MPDVFQLETTATTHLLEISAASQMGLECPEPEWFDLEHNDRLGQAATIRVGTVTTAAFGTAAAVSNSGTLAAAVLNFTIPAGEPVTNASINAAIEDDPGASVTALTAISDTSDTSLILEAVDSGTIIRTTAATTINVQMPDTDPGDGWTVMVIQGGAGQITFIPGTGNTIQSYLDLVSAAGQHAGVTIIRVAANTYWIGGQLT